LPRASREPERIADAAQRSRDAGALYVHLQSENGVEHRTLILSPRKVRTLRTLWSAWGIALLLAIGGSWIYFAVESMRIPLLRSRIAQLEAEAQRIDTLQARLQELQNQYDQVYRMLGATTDTTTQAGSKVIRQP
jgi:Tfp pilus assembly protein PilN